MKKRLSSIITLISILLPAAGQQVVMNFDDATLTGGTTPIANPWMENGLKLSCEWPHITGLSDMQIFGPGSSRDSGQKAVSAQWNRALFVLERENGGPFDMVSAKLFPFTSGFNATIEFTGVKAGGGSSVTQIFSTGGSLSGVVRTFPASFSGLSRVTWEVNNNQTNLGYHQFDDLLIQLPPQVTVPPSVTLSEGVEHAMRVKFSRALTAQATIDYSVSGTASAGLDYTGLINSGSLIVPAGSDGATITFTALADALNEGVETVDITWSTNSSSYELASTKTIVTIGDTNSKGFPGFIAGHGLEDDDAAAGADPNGDGITNLEAYLFRLNPAGPFPSAWLDRMPRFTTVRVGRAGVYPAITWQLPQPWPADVRFVIEETDDLLSWTEIARRTGYGVGSLWGGSRGTAVVESGSPLKVVSVPGAEKMSALEGSMLRLKLFYAPPLVIGR